MKKREKLLKYRHKKIMKRLDFLIEEHINDEDDCYVFIEEEIYQILEDYAITHKEIDKSVFSKYEVSDFYIIFNDKINKKSKTKKIWKYINKKIYY